MRHNRKNILFKIFAKYIRYLKELRPSYDRNVHDDIVLFSKIKEELNLVGSIREAQKFVEGHNNVSIREIYPLKFSIRGALKYKMQLAFIDFLREKGVYENYLRYGGKMALHGRVMRWIDVCGFFWTETEEGPEFWCKVSHEWKDFCLTTPILDD